MSHGTIRIAKDIQRQLTSEALKAIHGFMEQGTIRETTEDDTHIYIRLEHPDFVPDVEDAEYALYLTNTIDKWGNRHTVLSQLRIGQDGKFKVVKYYSTESEREGIHYS